MQIGPFHLSSSSSAHLLARSNQWMKEKADCLYAVCLKSDGTAPVKNILPYARRDFNVEHQASLIFLRIFRLPNVIRVPRGKASVLSAKKINRFKHVFLFGFTSTQHSASLFTCLGCLSIFFFNTRHTAQGAVSKWLKQAIRGSAFFRNIFGQAKTECRKNGTQGIIFIRNFQVE